RARLAVEILDLEIAGLVREHLLHLRLGGGESLARLAQPLDALFEQLQRLVEIELLRFPPAHALFEAVELLCEAQRLAGTGHHASPARAATSPSVTRSRKRSPDGNCATRFSTRPCSSRASAYPRSRTFRGDKASRRPASPDSSWRCRSSRRSRVPVRRSSVRSNRSATRPERPARPRASRAPRCASSTRTSARSGVAASAAADGVAARTSATRSHSVTSVSWPTAEITGTGSAATARATRS